MPNPLSCLLVTIYGEDNTKQKVVTESPFVIGRSTECAVALSDLKVSRQHVLVKNKGGKVWIQDQASGNGTFVNGKKLEPERLTPVEPGDRIRLGKSLLEVSIQTVERVFSESVLDEISLSHEDRESILNMIHGAHAEAARLVELGKETHDNFIRTSEQRAAAIEQQMIANREKVMEEVEQQAKAKIAAAKAQHDKVVGAAENDAIKAASVAADRVRNDAKAAATATTEKAKAASVQIVDSARKEASSTLEAARRETAELLENAKAEAASVLSAARKEAAAHVETHRETSEKEARSYFELRRKEYQAFADNKLKEVDVYRERQEQESHKAMAAEIDDFEKRKEKLETDLKTANEDFKRVQPAVIKLRKEMEELATEVASLQEQSVSLKQSAAEAKELESKRQTLILQIDKYKTDCATAEQELTRRLAEIQDTIKKEGESRRKNQDEELVQLRLSEMERIKRERSAGYEELIRERERLGRRILSEIENVIVKSVPTEKWRAAAKDVETVIQANLRAPSVASDTEATATPLIAEIAKSRRRSRILWTVQGLVLGAGIWIAADKASERIAADNDPMKTASEERSREMKEDLQRRKFNPAQDDEFRATYAGNVIYMKNFVDNYRSAEFQKHWHKKASNYFLKKWKVQEETTIEVMATLNTLVETLEQRKESIHPDYVNDGLKKMDELETATVEKVSELLGSEVRLEAFKRLEKKTYIEFFSHREPAAEDIKEEN